MSDIPAQVKQAEYWDPIEGGRIECRLCPHHCRLKEGQAGLCRVRIVRDGKLAATGYGRVSAAHVDPVEKKPLYHFHPGLPVFSLGGWGCNFRCMFCQNWTISQSGAAAGEALHSPAEMIESAIRAGCRLIAYTYNEPLVGFEYVRDCSRLARAAGLRNVLVTNGYIESQPARELLPLTDALNVDIKSISDEFYRRHCHGTLEPVLRFCGQAIKAGCHLEITNLIIPTLNDRPDDLARLARWVREHLGPLTPLHLSAYHPDYQSRIEGTPAATLTRAWETASRELSYVYMGNLLTRQGQATRCPQCGTALIEREGYAVRISGIVRGACGHCGRKADVVMDPA